MDKKRSLLNVFTAIFFKIIILVLGILVRRFLIQYVGNSANGLNSLYSSILGVLALTELGFGSAIVFSMYKPIVENDKEKVAAIYRLYVKIYRIITLIIFILGLVVMPFLPLLSKDATGQNLYLTFFIFLVSVVISYFNSAKVSLINAHKNNYITTTFSSLSIVLEHVLQIVVLLTTKSFVWYLVCKVVGAVFNLLLVHFYFNKHHKEILNIKSTLDPDTKKEITKNTKAMLAHKIGGVLVNTIDSLVISIFLGAILLGKYSNYTVIMTSMVGVISLFFSPLTSIIGQYCVSENVEKQQKLFNFIYLFNFIIAVIFFLGYYAVIDNVVQVIFMTSAEQDLILARSVPFIITLNYFIQFMRNTTLTFRDAKGMFYYDRFKPIFEGILNVILSCIFVNFFGVVGVIVATIITNLFICHIVEPFVLYKHGFNKSPKNYYLKNFSFILVFALLLFGINYLFVRLSNPWLNILANGFIAVGVGIVPLVITLIVNKEFRNKLFDLIKTFFTKIFKKKSK